MLYSANLTFSPFSIMIPIYLSISSICLTSSPVLTFGITHSYAAPNTLSIEFLATNFCNVYVSAL